MLAILKVQQKVCLTLRLSGDGRAGGCRSGQSYWRFKLQQGSDWSYSEQTRPQIQTSQQPGMTTSCWRSMWQTWVVGVIRKVNFTNNGQTVLLLSMLQAHDIIHCATWIDGDGQTVTMVPRESILYCNIKSQLYEVCTVFYGSQQHSTSDFTWDTRTDCLYDNTKKYNTNYLLDLSGGPIFF